MPIELKSAPPSSPAQVRAELLRRFVKAYWLRPENALWMTLRSMALEPYPWIPPLLDLACGDGVFSFLHCGGVFTDSFDVFASVANVGAGRGTREDMYDFLGENYQPPILRRPTRMIDIGTDKKKTMLAKASRLNLYDRRVEHDNNQPLPFPDRFFQTVYCNAAYWVSEIDAFLCELRRITRPDGRILLQVKLDSMERYTLQTYQAVLGDALLDIMDGGRMAWWPTVASRTVWEARFASAGLAIEAQTPIATRTHAHLWDVGLRPIAPLLVKMTAALAPETRLSIKREWVDLMCELLTPLCRSDLNLFSGPDEPAETQYVLSPM